MRAEYIDVLIIGAGISGIGSACHLKAKCREKNFIILEERDSLGGTWDLFRYPGIRSDSDMYTFGYNFNPWPDGKSIADGITILKYLKQTSTDHNIDKHIRYRHQVKSASWCSQDSCWKVDALNKEDGERVSIRSRFLLVCSGYYDYRRGYTPVFKTVFTQHHRIQSTAWAGLENWFDSVTLPLSYHLGGTAFKSHVRDSCIFPCLGASSHICLVLFVSCSSHAFHDGVSSSSLCVFVVWGT